MEVSMPPGFRFHPTEEELVGYYLLRRMQSMKIDLDVIVDIDLYKMEPWDIQARCKLGYEEQNEWYFFSHKDRKYPTGSRTNRATAAGFWKATGRDKAVLSKNKIIGMRKTLVFYKGRAPNGRKTDWIMHEYRYQTTEHGPPQEEGWVVCRAFKKPMPNQRPGIEAWNGAYFAHDTSSHGGSHLIPPYVESAANSTYTLHTAATASTQGSRFDYNSLASKSDQFPERNVELVELPQLESPGPADQEIMSSGDDPLFSDWKSLGSLLAFQGNDTGFFPFQNSPSIPQVGDLEAKYDVGHFLGFSPDS